MLKKTTDIFMANALNVAAFSILGLLFITKSSTFVPVVLLIVGVLLWMFSKPLRMQHKLVFVQGDFKWIARAFLFWFVALLLLMLIHPGGDKIYFPDNALRMLAATVLLVVTMRNSTQNWFLRGLLMAGAAAAFWAVSQWPADTSQRVIATTNNAIHFGNLSALVMLLCVSVVMLKQRLSVSLRLLFGLAAIGGLLGALASMSRSSFVVLLCFLPLLWLGQHGRTRKWVLATLLAFSIAIALVIMSSDILRNKFRITETQTEIQLMIEGNYYTSLGARVAMWQTAWIVFKEKPLVGMGQGRFPTVFAERMQSGEIPSTEIFGQPHSDILHALSAGGVLRFFAYLGLIVAPFIFFLKRFVAVKLNAEKRLMPILGMQVVATYFLTGLTNSNFDLQIYSTTYAVLVCVLARLSVDEINVAEPSKPSAPVSPSC